jgi:hypothetical protein
MLLVENLSINNKETKWEVISPENEIIQTSELKNPSIILGIMNPDGYYTLRLTSYSRKEKKSSVESSTKDVFEAAGQGHVNRIRTCSRRLTPCPMISQGPQGAVSK